MYIKNTSVSQLQELNTHYIKFINKNISKQVFCQKDLLIGDVPKQLPNSIIITANYNNINNAYFLAFHHYEDPMTIALFTYNYFRMKKIFNENLNYMSALVYRFDTPIFETVPLTSFIILKKYKYLQRRPKIEKFKYIKKLRQNIENIQKKYFDNVHSKLSLNDFDLNKIYGR